ncbi:MAG: hypothetical protein DYG91_00720 [Chloroflexi bacterium CFX7]|nr:hypothetical protein [Chloroflexi bacterium CFX7]
MGEKESASAVQASSRMAGASGEGIAIDEEGVQRAASEAGGPSASKTKHDTVKNSIQNIR